MGNIAPTVAVELGGTVRHMRLDFNALMEFEDLTGRDPLKGQLEGVGTRDLATLVLVALKHEDPDLTLPDVAGWLHLENAAYVLEQLSKLRERSVPEPDGSAPFSRAQPDRIDWLGLWAYARYDLGLPEADFWRLTPRMFYALADRHRAERQHGDMRVAMLATLIANIWRGKGPAKRVDDFMLTRVERKALPPETLKQKAIAAFTALGLPPEGSMATGNLSDLFVRLRLDAAEFNKGLGSATKSLSAAGADFGRIGRGLTAGLTLPLVGAAGAAVTAGLKFDDAFDKIRAGTGATGTALQGLETDFREVFKTVPASVDDVSTAIADLAARTGLTGPPLQHMARQVLELSRLTGTDLATNIRGLNRVFGDWTILTQDQSRAADLLFRVHQNTGIGIGELTDTVVQFGAPLRNLGFDFETAAVLVGKFEKEGVNTETVMAGLKIGLANLSQPGVDAKVAFVELVQAIKDAETPSERVGLAMELFGKRAGADMAAAIHEGRFEIDELLATIEGGEDTILGAAEDTRGFAENMVILKNQVTAAIEPLGTALVGAMDKLQPTIVRVAEGVADVIKAFTELPKSVQTVIGILAGVLTVAGPFLVALGLMLPALAVLVTPVGLVVLALAGLGLGLAALWAKSETFRDITTGAFNVVSTVIKEAVEGWKLIWDEWGDELVAGTQWMVDGVVAVWQGLVAIVEGLVAVIEDVWKRHGDTVLNNVRIAWEVISAVVQGALTIIRDTIMLGVNVIQQDWAAGWENIKGILSGFGGAALGIVTAIWSGIKRQFIDEMNVIIIKVNEFVGVVNETLSKISFGKLAIPELETLRSQVDRTRVELDKLPLSIARLSKPAREAAEGTGLLAGAQGVAATSGAALQRAMQGVTEKVVAAKTPLQGFITQLTDEIFALTNGAVAADRRRIATAEGSRADRDAALALFDHKRALEDAKVAQEKLQKAQEEFQEAVMVAVDGNNRTQESVQKTIDKLELERIKLIEGEDAYRRRVLAQQGATLAQAEEIIALEDGNAALDASQKAHGEFIGLLTSKFNDFFKSKLPGWLQEWGGFLSSALKAFAEWAGGMGGWIGRIAGWLDKLFGTNLGSILGGGGKGGGGGVLGGVLGGIFGGGGAGGGAAGGGAAVGWGAGAAGLGGGAGGGGAAAGAGAGAGGAGFLGAFATGAAVVAGTTALVVGVSDLLGNLFGWSDHVDRVAVAAEEFDKLSAEWTRKEAAGFDLSVPSQQWDPAGYAAWEASRPGSMHVSSGGQTVVLQVDGRTLGKVLIPYQVTETQIMTGVKTA